MRGGREGSQIYSLVHSYSIRLNLNTDQSSSIRNLSVLNSYLKSLRLKSSYSITSLLVTYNLGMSYCFKTEKIGNCVNQTSEKSVTLFSEICSLFLDIMSGSIGALNGIPRWKAATARGTNCFFFITLSLYSFYYRTGALLVLVCVIASSIYRTKNGFNI